MRSETPRSFLNALGRLAGLGCFAGLWIGCGFSGRVHARLVKGQAQLRRKLAAKFKVAVGLRSAQAVVQMSGVKHEPQLRAACHKNAQQRNRIRATRQRHGNAHSGLEQGGVERQR